MTFNKKLIKAINFTWVELELSKYSYTGQYGQATSNIPNGKRVLYWNHGYYGKGLHHLTIKEDGGTRTVFHGKISTKKELEFVLKLVH